MKSLLNALFAFSIACCVVCCSPADSADNPDRDETEKPTPPLPPPVDPDQPGGNEPSDPGTGDPGAGEPGTNDPDVPLTPDPELSENSIQEYFSYNFVTTPAPEGYRMINHNNLPVVQPSKAGVRFYEDYNNSAQANWFVYSFKTGTYALTSYALDMKEDTSADNWLITEGIQVKYNKTLLCWKICAVDLGYPMPQSYEVYLTTRPTPSVDDFLAEAPIYQDDAIYPDNPSNDKQNNVNYALEGYEGKTVYLAFRHTTQGKTKVGITLFKLSMSSFLRDYKDLEVTGIRSWWNSKPTNVTGFKYPIGAELTTEITFKNVGFDIQNEPLTARYTYDGKTVTEAIGSVSLKLGESYTYQFKEAVTYTGVSSLTAKLDPLPNETRVYANYRTLAGLITVKHPVMIRVLYEEASGLDCSVCSTLFTHLDKVDAAYPDRTVAAMHVVDRKTQWPYPAATGEAYRNYVMSKSRLWAAPPYAAANRDMRYVSPNTDLMPGMADVSRSPNLETPLTKDYTSECYSPMEITATHRFSDDKKKMYVDVVVEALEDLEGLNYGIGGLVLEDNVQHKNYTMLSLGAPVFKHLVRGVLGDMRKGVTGVIPVSMTEGQKVTCTLEYDIPDMYDVLVPNSDQMYAAVMIIRADESILTCNKTTKTAAK